MTVEERIKMQRDQKLIQLGYCTRVYMPITPEYDEDDEESAAPVHEYPYFDEDKQQHVRLVADEVTDEQFQRILAIGGERVVDSSNRLASVTMVLAWIGFIIFCLAGFAIASAGREFDFVPFLTWCSIGAGCLLSLLWFAEVLKLLQRIHDKL